MRKLLIICTIMSLILVINGQVSADPVIDGIISTSEWDAYYLGTSVTAWQGGMSVDVYGFTDGTYLYAAYVADMSQLGWSVAAGLCLSNNLYYKTPQSVSWPDPGYTLLAAGGYPADVLQTDGSDWTSLPGSFADYDIEYYFGDGCYNTIPNPNVAEVKIPLSLITYAGYDGLIRLSGQYWQYASAQSFYVEGPPSFESVGECISANIDDECAGLKGQARANCVKEQIGYCHDLFDVPSAHNE